MQTTNATAVHEKLCQWIDENYIPQQTQPVAMVLSKSACCNLTALGHLEDQFPVGDEFVYDGYEEYPCSIISTFTTYLENKPTYRTGALLFKFSAPDGRAFESLVVAAWTDFQSYDQTRALCMTLQTAVNFTEYFRCYVVGQEKVHIMPYDPRRPFHERYLKEPPAYPPALIERVEADSLTLCRALGYDLNTVEFAVEDGVPYAIDFMNPAPDADPHSVGASNFEWIVDAVATFAVRKAQEPPTPPAYRWSAMLEGRK